MQVRVNVEEKSVTAGVTVTETETAQLNEAIIPLFVGRTLLDLTLLSSFIYAGSLSLSFPHL